MRSQQSFGQAAEGLHRPYQDFLGVAGKDQPDAVLGWPVQVENLRRGDRDADLSCPPEKGQRRKRFRQPDPYAKTTGWGTPAGTGGKI